MRDEEQRPASVLLDSGDFPAGNFSLWREAVARTILGLDFQPIGDRPLRVRMAATFAGDVLMSRSHTTPVSTIRDKELSSVNGDAFVLALAVRGPLVTSQFGEEMVLSPGEATLMSCDDIGAMSCPQGGQYLTFLLPRGFVRAQDADIEAKLMKKISARSSRLRLVNSYARLLAEKGATTDPEARAAMGRHLGEMIVLAVGDGALNEPRMATLMQVHHETLKAIIAKRASDPATSLASVAAESGLSPRQIQYVFEQAGTSFTDVLIEARLTAAYRLLSENDTPTTRIVDVASAAGFSDLSFFNRRFRAQFGTTPSSIRGARGKPGSTGCR